MRRVHQPFLKLLACSAIVIIFLLFSLDNAQAALVFDMCHKFNGDGVMYGPPPWLKVTFDDGDSADTVNMTITAVGLTGSEKVGRVLLNIDPALNPTQLVFSDMLKTGGFDNPIISTGINSFKADGDGLYDILIEFDTDGPDKAFNCGESVEYTITLASLTPASFDFISAPGDGMGEYKTAAHILSPGGISGQSAWITPEPATICLLGLGGLALLRKIKA